MKIRQAINYLHENGIKLFFLKLFRNKKCKEDLYSIWKQKNDVSSDDLKQQSLKIFKYQPRISIVVPTYNTDKQYLVEMVDSVKNQSYFNWELCIADGSTEEQVEEVLVEYARQDSRIKIKKLMGNQGIAGNTNEAFSMVTGEYIGLLDHDDVLRADALYEIVNMLNDNENVDVIYTDEDKVSADSKIFFEPHFKSDFNEELLCSNNYICHFFVVKREILNMVGGVREEFEGAQDYDFILRCVEQAKKVCHIPKPLYHWRSFENSTAQNPESKLFAYESGKRAIEAHLERKGIRGRVNHCHDLGFYHVSYSVVNNPKVTIIIECNDKKDLYKCMQAVKKKAEYTFFEIVVAESEILSGEVLNEYIVFLQDYVEPISQGWLKEMLGSCQRNGVGMVAGKIYNKDETIYHAGIILGMKGYAFSGMSRTYKGYFHRDSLQQELSAVGNDFCIIKKEVLGEMSLNEYLKMDELLRCRYVRQKGYKIIYNPEVEAYTIKKNQVVHKDGNVEFEKDQFYNENLSLEKNCFELKV